MNETLGNGSLSSIGRRRFRREERHVVDNGPSAVRRGGPGPRRLRGQAPSTPRRRCSRSHSGGQHRPPAAVEGFNWRLGNSSPPPRPARSSASRASGPARSNRAPCARSAPMRRHAPCAPPAELPPEVQQHLLKRFFRASTARSGVGRAPASGCLPSSRSSAATTVDLPVFGVAELANRRDTRPGRAMVGRCRPPGL